MGHGNDIVLTIEVQSGPILASLDALRAMALCLLTVPVAAALGQIRERTRRASPFETEQPCGRKLFRYLRVKGQHIVHRKESRVKAKDTFLKVGQSIPVLIHMQRVRGHLGALWRFVKRGVFEAVHNVPAIQLLLVRQAVAVAVPPIGIRSQHRLLGVVQAITIAVRVQWLGAGLVFIKIRQAVAVTVPPAVIRVGPGAEQPVAVSIPQSGEADMACLAPCQGIAALFGR